MRVGRKSRSLNDGSIEIRTGEDYLPELLTAAESPKRPSGCLRCRPREPCYPGGPEGQAQPWPEPERPWFESPPDGNPFSTARTSDGTKLGQESESAG